MSTIVGVLRGGPSSEHDVSLATGQAILRHLSPEHFTTRDIYIDKDGVWHEKGIPTSPQRVLPQLDLVIIGLHGLYGEDGTIQRLLELHGVPYTGSDSFASRIAMHKVLTKEKAREAHLLTPKYHYIKEDADIHEATAHVIRTFHQPVVVKPVKNGSSVGVSMVGGYAPVYQAILSAMADGGVLVEERVKGREATVGVVEGFRGETLYQLPVIEIIPPEQALFFDSQSKYNGLTREIVPGRFTKLETEELLRQASRMHETLGLRHYSRSDFIVSPNGIYFLETNTLPGLTPESLMPKALHAVGVSFSDFLYHLVSLSLKKTHV